MTDSANDLPSLSVKRPLLVAVLNILIIIAGLAAMLGVEVRELPDVDRPIVSVRATLPGAAPETMDAEVTSIVEGAVARVSGVVDIASSSEENSMRLRAEFSPSTDLDVAAADVREAVSRVVRDLPDRVEELVVTKSDQDAQPIIQLAVMSNTLNEQDLTRIVDNDIIPEILSVSGVASVDPFGERERQMRVVVDPLRLSRFGLTIADVAGVLQNAPFDVPVGSFRLQDQELIVRAEASAATPELIEEVVIDGETKIGDVADAYFAPADARSYVRLDGRTIIGLGVIRQARSNTIQISDAVRSKVDQLNDRFDNVDIAVTSDDAVFISESVGEVLRSLLFTIVIVVATIWLFFGKWQAALAPSMAIPVALVGAVAGIWLFGFSINLLTLLALVLATGLIVDDAIVVLENIQRLQAKGIGRRAAAVLGARQVFFAVISTTVVLVSVFVPISFLPSTAGRLFREFGFVLALAVVVSSFVALTIVPALAARLTLHAKSDKPSRLNRWGGVISRGYDTTLGKALDRPKVTVAVSVVAAAGAIFAYFALDNEIVPDEDRGEFYMMATGPDGVGLDYAERQSDEMEKRLQPFLDSGEIRSLFTIVGRYDPNRVYISAPLAPWDERERSQQEIMDDVNRALSDIPGSRIRVFGRNSLELGGGGRGGGLEVALTGPTYPQIFEAARDLVAAIEARSEILGDIEISYQPTQPQLSIKIDRRRAADLGVPLDELSTTLRAMVGGEDIVDLNVDDQAVPIFLTARNDAITDPSDLRNLYVRSTAGHLIPLSVVTTMVEEGVAAELDRTEQRRAIEIDAEIVSDASLAEAVAEIRALAADVLPENIDLILTGDAEALDETSNALLLTYAFAFAIVFLVLVAQFESLTSPFVILLTVPFGMAAAVYALMLTGVSLNIYSQIGLVMLIGLMAKNGILIVEFADQLRAEGKSVRDAVFEAASTRMRAIMMTLISTVLGALPLVLATGAGAEARTSIGWVVFGGLGLAAIFTLYLNPVIYLAVARHSAPRSVGARSLAEELESAKGVSLSADPKGSP